MTIYTVIPIKFDYPLGTLDINGNGASSNAFCISDTTAETPATAADIKTSASNIPA